MARVGLERISRRFGSMGGIEEITFEIPDGEFWVLVGPSGCGKSTILRTIAGLETATSGDLYIGDRRVNDIPARQRDVAMVFQNYALYPHMTVAENLAFGLRMRRAEASSIQTRVEAVAQMLEIGHLLDRKPRQLSGGQQQRVALGRAIARQPQVFLLDEPLSNLDAQLRDDTRAELKQLHQRVGITTVYVTHDQVEAMTLADQIVVLDQGRIQQIGTPQAIYSQPANRMVATFLGSPPMNILPATYDGDGFQLGTQAIACPDALRTQVQPSPGQRLELGFRPEAIQVVNDGADALSPEASLHVEVTVVEPLGRETLVRARVEGASVTVDFSVAPERGVRVGHRLQLRLDLAQAYVFDPSGVRYGL
jgi:multiple sugar transport system ATP-binding protein